MVSDTAGRQTVYLDLTHLGRHVTGIERVTIEQFEKVDFPGADVRAVRSTGVLNMILKQQLLLPLLALLHPRALFLFPGFPPSPLFRLIPERVIFYVHDLFLMTRTEDLSLKARLYMAWPFRVAVSGLKYFLTNSAKTRTELAPHVRSGAAIALYRPTVTNLFGLDAARRRSADVGARPLRIVAVGTLEPRKNYPAAIAILAALRRTGHANAELHIIGREGWGGAKASLEGQPGVTLHGYLSLEAARAVIESADLYLCTSHDEGLGLPLLEVQFGGLPIVAPDQTVFREALGLSGIFIDPGKPDAAAATIAALVADTGRMERHGQLSSQNVATWNARANDDRARIQRLFDGPLHATVVKAAEAKAV